MTMGIGKTIRGIDIEKLSAWVVAKNACVGASTGWAVRAFNLSMMEGAFLKVKPATWFIGKAAYCMMGIGRIDAMQNAFTNISNIIAIGIFKEQEIGLMANEESTVPEFKTGRNMKPVCKDFAFVRFAIAIGIFEDEDFIIHFFFGFPMGIRGHYSNPKAAPGIKSHLYGLCKFREFFFRCEEFNLQAFANCHLGNSIFAIEEDMLASGKRAGLVGDNFEKGCGVGIIIGKHFAVGSSTDFLITISGHLIKDLHFSCHHDPVGLACNETKICTPTINGIPIYSAIAIEPMKILLKHRGAQFIQKDWVFLNIILKELLLNDLSNQLITKLVQMNTIDR